MIVAVPRQRRRREHRVALVPAAVAGLVRRGAEVVVEAGAGAGARFADPAYEAAGARIVYDAEEAWRRADLVCTLGSLTEEDAERLAPGAAVTGFHHLAVAPRPLVERLLAARATLIGWEVVEDSSGARPVLLPLSEIGGQMAIHAAAQLLQTGSQGRGILLGGLAGVPPPTVLVLGAGAAGRSAARTAWALGAHVLVVDADRGALERLHREFDGHVVTAMASAGRLEQLSAVADVVVGAVHVPGGRPPYLLTEDMVRRMKEGSVIVDLSIDQGGCVETSRPTDHDAPTFRAHGVIHFCVPNLTAHVARTASRVLSHASLPYLEALVDAAVAAAAAVDTAAGVDPPPPGIALEAALVADPGLARGVYLHRGRLVHRRAAASLGLAAADLGDLLTGPARDGSADLDDGTAS